MKARLENGSIRIYSKLPSRYRSENLNVAGGFHLLTTTEHESEGFYDLVTPTITNTQKLGGAYFDGVKFTYTVVDLTNEEIEEKQDAIVLALLSQFESDGIEFLNKVRTAIKKKYDNGNITQAQYKGIRNNLAPALQPLKNGDWDIAKDNLDAIAPPSNQQMLNIYNFLMGKLEDYLLNDFS